MPDPEIPRTAAAHRMAHQVDPVRIDVEFFANGTEDIHYVQLAQFPEVLRVAVVRAATGAADWTASGPAAPVPSVVVVAHGCNDDVSALFRKLREALIADHVVRDRSQTMQRNDERCRTRAVVLARYIQ